MFNYLQIQKTLNRSNRMYTPVVLVLTQRQAGDGMDRAEACSLSVGPEEV